ncbi:Myb/SANT-like domain containing protein [Senna tora]|uniref:Myb/SANT-like domain containing protein n=1 Tax=Senna tora TaxID=362788 RepID=A0A834W3Z2_9FABA|nr:Myb/SANT-like domain containing protein [Senna tora]
MSNSGGFAVTRTHGSDRFYNPPAVRRNQQLVLQQQQQLQRPFKSDTRVEPLEAETRADSDDSSLSRPNSVSSSSPPRTANLTNLDRLMESVAPLVPAQFLSEPRIRGRRTPEADGNLYFFLGDLWESFREWSAYGVEVPLLLNGNDSVKQYYIPYLSGIQLYVEPHRLRRPSEDSDAESSRETSSAGSSDCETEKLVRGGVDGAWMQRNLMNVNSQRLSRLSLRERPPPSSSSDETEVCNSPGQLLFEYFEREQPHFRPPVYDKVLSLASQFPDLKKYRSCDLLPSSWFSVAWYPIYRIPVGSTLRSLDASFLTFHSLSTLSRSKIQPQFHTSSGRKVHGVGAKISLPVFALASYKLRGSILTPDGSPEWQQAHSLLQAADNWLQRLQVKLPDYQYFVSHSSPWR